MKSSDGRFEYCDGNSLPDNTSLEQVGRMGFQCRSREGERCEINIKNAGHQIEHHNWILRGTVDQPTISPSINCADCWHGFIENGVFVNTTKQPEPKQ